MKYVMKVKTTTRTKFLYVMYHVENNFVKNYFLWDLRENALTMHGLFLRQAMTKALNYSL